MSSGGDGRSGSGGAQRPRDARSGRPATTRLAVRFGWVSLLQDVASKMVVPAVPLFLTISLGAEPVVVGVVDGLATAAVVLAAPISGRLVTRVAPLNLVRVGYGLSSAMKLALAAVTTWPGVLAVRTLDRAGKGVRDAPRDLLLTDGDPGGRGHRFGIVQAMDKFGGFLGPLAGLAVYELAGSSFRAVFLVAFLPAVVSTALLWGVPTGPARRRPVGDRGARGNGRTRSQRIALAAVSAQVLLVVPLALVIVRATDVGMGVAGAMGAFALYNLTTSASSWPAGVLVDRFGAHRMVVAGMVVAAASMVAAAEGSAAGVWLALGLYGVAEGVGRPAAKVWLVELGPTGSAGAVLGDRMALAAMVGLGSGLLYGAMATWSSLAAFATSAGAATLLAIATALWRPAPAAGPGIESDATTEGDM